MRACADARRSGGAAGSSYAIEAAISALVCTAETRKDPLLAQVGRSSGPGVRWTLGLQGALTECSAIESTKMVSHGTQCSSLRAVTVVSKPTHADRH